MQRKLSSAGPSPQSYRRAAAAVELSQTADTARSTQRASCGHCPTVGGEYASVPANTSSNILATRSVKRSRPYGPITCRL